MNHQKIMQLLRDWGFARTEEELESFAFMYPKVYIELAEIEEGTKEYQEFICWYLEQQGTKQWNAELRFFVRTRSRGWASLESTGSAAFIETPGQNILFDTGQGFSLLQNSLRLKKDLRHVSKLVLSHGDLDHTGGLLAFLEVKGACPVAAHPDIFNERFLLMPGAGGEEKPVSIGMPWPQAYLTTRGAQFEWRRDFTEVAPGVFVTGEVPRKTLFELGSPKFVVASGRRMGSRSFSR